MKTMFALVLSLLMAFPASAFAQSGNANSGVGSAQVITTSDKGGNSHSGGTIASMSTPMGIIDLPPQKLTYYVSFTIVSPNGAQCASGDATPEFVHPIKTMEDIQFFKKWIMSHPELKKNCSPNSSVNINFLARLPI